MINVNDLYFKYNPNTISEIKAVNGISTTISEGEFVVVLGHNGCGKSTLAKHLNALLLPLEGDVIVDNLNTKDEVNLWEIRKKCGMVFQNPDNQMVASVIEEEVAFGPENLGVPPDEIRTRIIEALEAVGIGADRAKAPSTLLSGGQKQRLAIAGIIAMYPKYIILDESTSMLDPQGRKEVLKTVKNLNKNEGITVIHITHSMEEAVEADRILVMEAGKIVMNGKPAQIFSQVEKLRELRLDVPPMSQLAYSLRKNGLNIPDSILTIDEMEEYLFSIMAENHNKCQSNSQS